MSPFADFEDLLKAGFIGVARFLVLSALAGLVDWQGKPQSKEYKH